VRVKRVATFYALRERASESSFAAFSSRRLPAGDYHSSGVRDAARARMCARACVRDDLIICVRVHVFTPLRCACCAARPSVYPDFLLRLMRHACAERKRVQRRSVKKGVQRRDECCVHAAEYACGGVRCA